jgi:protein-export membrane protein SecD
MAKKNQIGLIIVIVLAFFTLNFAFPKYINQGIDFLNSKSPLRLPRFPEVSFKLGLDLQGGSHLVYEADLKNIQAKERGEAMQGLRDVIERRVNLFGVREPVVRTQQVGDHYRLIVELPGVKNVSEAIKMIGKTPYLEFREEVAATSSTSTPTFKPTKLTGQYLKRATLGFDQTTLEPEVLLEFDSEGAKLFKEITKRNVGKRLAIYIDNVLISAPVVREEISGGKAQITGNFTVDQARELARNLNAGALPVPIKLISQTTVGPTLGSISLTKSLRAGMFGFLAVILFMIIYYRLSGFLASLALLIYAGILLTLFKAVPVTLTLAGIGGAILSVGMAVDANVLIFERMKEERRAGESFQRAVEAGFSRAWPSIRDSNLTTLLVALIMFSFGTSFVKGFALTLSLGIIVSMFSAIFITRTFLRSFVGTKLEKIKWLWG